MANTRSKHAKVLILYTGGTFGMAAPRISRLKRFQSRPLELSNLSPSMLRDRFLARVPELRELADCDVDVLFNRDSAHLGPHDWRLIAEKIGRAWSSYDGFVILHGTDTLAYTASALSFLLRPCKKPVVMTGAQRPLAALRTDARRNLISAVEIASLGPGPGLSQVTVLFDNRLFQGNRVRKRSATDYAAFESPKANPLAEIGSSIRFQPLKRSRDPVPSSKKLLPRFSSDVAVLHVTPGFPARSVEVTLLPRLAGLVLVIFPSLTAPTHDRAFIDLLKKARKLKVPVITATDDVHGEGMPVTRYTAGELLEQNGCFSAGEMTVECAFVKASHLLAQSGAPKNFARLWAIDFAGEGV